MRAKGLSADRLAELADRASTVVGDPVDVLACDGSTTVIRWRSDGRFGLLGRAFTQDALRRVGLPQEPDPPDLPVSPPRPPMSRQHRVPRVWHDFGGTTWFEWELADGLVCQLEIQPDEADAPIRTVIFGQQAGTVGSRAGVSPTLVHDTPIGSLYNDALDCLKTMMTGSTRAVPHLAGFSPRNADPVIRPRGGTSTRIPDLVLAAVARLYGDGKTAKSIGTDFNAALSTVKAWIRHARQRDLLNGRTITTKATQLLSNEGRTPEEILRSR